MHLQFGTRFGNIAVHCTSRRLNYASNKGISRVGSIVRQYFTHTRVRMSTDANGPTEPTSSPPVSGLEDTGSPTVETNYVEICEGRAKILFPSSNEVFYNPVQEFNRDLSIAVIKYYSQHLWEPGGSKLKKKRKDINPDMDAAPSGAVTESNKSEETKVELAILSEPASSKETEGGEREEKDTEEERMDLSEQDVEKSKEATAKFPTEKQTGLRILEALAASGLRSIRYALELPLLECCIANDLSKDAYHSMCRNIKHNGVADKVQPSWKEASMLMYEHREPHTKRFDVIDLDPYGSPSQFLDSTIQSVKDGGKGRQYQNQNLIIDFLPPSQGVVFESCHSKYGAMSLKARYCHEMALRIVLSSLESHANRYRRYIVPLLSCSIDFYVRVFVRVYTSPQEVKRSPSKMAMVYHCIGCESFHLQPIGKRLEQGRSRKYPPATGPPVDRHCDQCGSIFRLGGPIWMDPIHDVEFVKKLLSEVKSSPKGTYKTIDRITGLLTVVSEELQDTPLYYVLDSICSTVHCNTPKMIALRSAILNQGYRVSISHANANAIKTDAPHHVLWDIMRCWANLSLIKQPSPNSPAAAILSKEPQFKASFAVRKDANPPSKLMKLTRFPENPQANWGPKARAKRKGDTTEELPTKRQRMQGKRTKT